MVAKKTVFFFSTFFAVLLHICCFHYDAICHYFIHQYVILSLYVMPSGIISFYTMSFVIKSCHHFILYCLFFIYDVILSLVIFSTNPRISSVRNSK